MKTKQIVSFLAVTAVALAIHAAEPLATVADAVKALKDKANYSWSTTSEMANSQFPAMTTKGQTEKEGFTFLSSEGPNGEIQAVKKGTNGVVKTDDGWQTAAELRAAGGQGGGPGRGFSGRLLNAAAPADDAEELLKGVTELKAGDDGLFTGDLTEQAAKDRASFFGRRRGGQGGQGGGGFTPPEPKDAKGSVKFWVKDGVLSKLELHTTAKITFQGEERDIDRTTTTSISDIGSTKVEVPDDAKKKLP
jgi:hypothetical protein